jgi:LuxR family transcriptional regulator, maltose regulon positive regulatory protein
MVIAPGGYGKTSQVAIWAGSDQRTVAWVDLEMGHDDPERFLNVIVEALTFAGLRLEMPGTGRQTPRQLTTFVAPELGRAIRRSATPFVLVLDDVQHLRSQPTVDMLDALVRNVPASIHHRVDRAIGAAAGPPSAPGAGMRDRRDHRTAVAR